MRWRTLFLKLHLYLGLATGLVLVVVCLTGALLAFEEELEVWLHPERHWVVPREARLPLDALVQRVQAQLPEVELSSVTVHADPRRSVELGGGRGGPVVYADPYTGQVLDHFRRQDTFFFQVMALHRWLLVRPVGKWIVGVSTLLFLIILISGVVLWWPRNRKQLRKRTRVAFRRGWKRLNHDLHVSVGIYVALLLFIMGLTGLAWSFEWVNDAIYRITGTRPERLTPPEVMADTSQAYPLERALQAAMHYDSTAVFYSVSRPRPGQAVAVRLLPADASHSRAFTTLFVDPASGAVLQAQPFAARNRGDQVRSWFYALHVGAFGGWPVRLIWFVASLLGATFPVTGFLIWWHKRRKSKRPRRMASVSTASIS